MITKLDCPEPIKRIMLERSTSIMGSIQEEVTIADMLRDEREDAINECIINTIVLLKEFGIDKQSVISGVIEKYVLSKDQALDLVNKYY